MPNVRPTLKYARWTITMAAPTTESYRSLRSVRVRAAQIAGELAASTVWLGYRIVSGYDGGVQVTRGATADRFDC